MEPTLAVSAAFAIASAALYFYVGMKVAQRQVSPDARLASQMFSLWWVSLAALTVAGGLESLAASLGLLELPLFLMLTILVLLGLCVGLAGLLYYLVYLFTGKRRAIWPIVAFYVAYFALLVYYITWLGPDGIVVGRWTTTLHYAKPQSGPLYMAVVVLLTFPILLGAAAYGTLFFRVREATQRYRIALVSGGILVWFGSAFVGVALGVNQTDWWQVTSRAIGLGAAVAILLAYQPPRFVRRRWGIQPVAPAPQVATAPPPPSAAPAAPPDGEPPRPQRP